MGAQRLDLLGSSPQNGLTCGENPNPEPQGRDELSSCLGTSVTAQVPAARRPVGAEQHPAGACEVTAEVNNDRLILHE